MPDTPANVAPETIDTSKNRTEIGLRVDATIDDEKVALEAKIGAEVYVQLDRPASLGTPISFAYWLNETYKVPDLGIMMPDAYKTGAEFKDALKNYEDTTDEAKKTIFKDTIKANLAKNGVPDNFHELMLSALLVKITITDLLIDIRSKPEKMTKMMFGLSATFINPLPLLPGIEVNKLSFMIMNAPANNFTFEKRPPLPIEAAKDTKPEAVANGSTPPPT